MVRRFAIFATISFVLAFLLILVGVACSSCFQIHGNIINTIVFRMFLISVALIAINGVAKAIYTRWQSGRDVFDFQNSLTEKRDTIQKYATKWCAQLQRLRVLSDVYAILLVAFAVVMAFLTGIDNTLFVLAYPTSAFLMYAGLLRIRFVKDTQLDVEQICYIKEEDYPALYSLAKLAAKEIGCTKNIHIAVTNSDSVSIMWDETTISLAVGVICWEILSEEELYNVFLHEFAHVDNPFNLEQCDHRYQNLISRGGNHQSPLSLYAAKLFSFVDLLYAQKFSVYQYASALATEACADEAVKKHGSCMAMASCLLKSAYYTIHVWEMQLCDRPAFYESETPNTSYYRAYIPTFKAALSECVDRWNKLIQNEILSRQATHPTTQMRLEALSVTHYTVLDDQKNEELLSELERANNYIETILKKEWKRSYTSDRELEYVDVLKRVEKWEQEGKPLSSYAQVIVDLAKLGRLAQVEALCDRALAEVPKKECAYALLTKGLFLLHRYDDSGISYIYKAVRLSKRYFDAGMEAIGDYCCRTGNHEQLAKYREVVSTVANNS